MLLNYQLKMLGLPPVIVMNKTKTRDYYPALREYELTNRTDELENLIAGLLIEALHRRIAKLTARKIVLLAEWAKIHKVNPQSAANKALRGTIPAFRVADHWMIDVDFEVAS